MATSAIRKLFSEFIGFPKHAAFENLPSLQCEQSISLNSQECEVACRIGPGIDINPVKADIRFTDGSMPVNDIFCKMLFAREKFVADPQQILLLLIGQRHARLDSRVDEEKVTAHEAQSQIVEKSPLMGRDCPGKLFN